MDKKDFFEKARVLIKELVQFSSEIKAKKECMGAFDCEDGTKMESPDAELKVGSEVFNVDENGNQTPVEDGEKVLADGSKIVIKDGKVEAITAVEEKPQEEVKSPVESEMVEVPEVEVPEVEDPAEEEKEVEKEDEMDLRVSKIEKKIEEILDIVSRIGEKQGKVNEQMLSKLEEFSEENGGEPIKKTKKEYIDYTPGKGIFKEELKDLLNSRRK